MSTDAKSPNFFSTDGATPAARGSQPLIHQRGREMQAFGTVRLFSIASPHEARMQSSQLLNQILADSMILHSHSEVRDAVAATTASRDDGTNDLLMSDVLRRHELQVWFVAEHLVDTSVTRA
jgi:hypothetical protein